ncbi:MAG: hypothetical protein HQ543_09930, partial [Bacteroidetes bacterium]|nr:hypothetical protein [Bacteroidota bacterium]
MLIGSYFTKEYSIESSALFNPSIVAHPDQSILKKGRLRVIISFRAVGEGHISSIVFRKGIITENGDLSIDTKSALVERGVIETRDFIHFKISSLIGKGSQNKGIALFPEKIKGKYAIISRNDNENLYIMFSD